MEVPRHQAISPVFWRIQITNTTDQPQILLKWSTTSQNLNLINLLTTGVSNPIQSQSNLKLAIELASCHKFKIAPMPQTYRIIAVSYYAKTAFFWWAAAYLLDHQAYLYFGSKMGNLKIVSVISAMAKFDAKTISIRTSLQQPLATHLTSFAQGITGGAHTTTTGQRSVGSTKFVPQKTMSADDVIERAPP